MRHFQLLAAGIDIAPLLVAVKRQPDLWQMHTIRQDFPGTPHADTETILLRWQQDYDRPSVADEHESICYPAWFALPQARALILSVMTRVEGIRLGRCLIVNLKPGGHIHAHADGGNHASYYERAHLVLQSEPGNRFRCGAEEIWLRPGELWWFENEVEHEVWNDSPAERWHCIIDYQAAP